MDKNTAIELNTLSKKITAVMNTLDRYFSDRHNENKDTITEAQDAICESSSDTEQRLTEIEDALCELSEVLLESEV